MARIRHTNKKCFQRGDQEEVYSNMKGFAGSFWRATVVANMGNTYVVEYKDLIEEYDESTLLKETVLAKHVRPLPPTTLACGFSENDKVNAFDKDGWWVGKVTRREEGSDKYYVFFETYGQEIAYPREELRFHLDWRWGRWVTPNSSTKRSRNGESHDDDDYDNERSDSSAEVSPKEKLCNTRGQIQDFLFRRA